MAAVLKKIGKWVLRIVVGIILLLIVVWLLLQTQWGKNLVKDKAVSYLKNKLQTEVRIDAIDVDWFNRLQLQGVYLEDRQKRELAYIGNLETKYSLVNIFRNKLTIGSIKLDEVRASILRPANDSVFNYQFIIDAFAGTEPEKKDSSSNSKPFILELKNLELSNIRLLMDDQYGGQVYKLSAGFLKTRLNNFDLDKMKIGADYFYTDSIHTNIQLLKSSEPTTKTAKESSTDTATPFTITADTIHLGRSVFYFKNALTEMEIDSKANDIAAANVRYNQAKMNLLAKSFLVTDHSTAFKMKTADTTAAEIPADSIAPASQPFTFFIGQVDIDKNNFSMDNLAAPALAAKNSIDFNHFNFAQIGLHADSVAYDGQTYTASIKDAALTEKSGFKLSRLKGRIIYNDTNAIMRNLALTTNTARIEGSLAAKYTSLSNISTQPGNTFINASINNSNLQLNDLLFFSPDLARNPNFASLMNKTFFINTEASGTLAQLNIPSLSLKQGELSLLASAWVYNVTDAQKFRVDLNLKQFTGSRSALLALLPRNTIPDSILHYIPQSFALSGTYKGSVNDFVADLKLASSLGNISVKGTAKNITDTKNALYDLNIGATELKLGQILQDSNMNHFSGTIAIKGKGFEPSAADMQYKAHISEFDYNGYKYHSIALNGTMKKNVIDAKMDATDPNLLLASHTTIDLNNRRKIITTTNIENADLQKLGFSKEFFSVKSNIQSNILLKENGRIAGELNITASDIFLDKSRVLLDTLEMLAIDSAGIQNILLNTPFANASLTGDYTLQNIGPAFTTIANKYYKQNSPDTVFGQRVQADFLVNVHTPQKLYPFVPGLTMISPFTLTGNINTDSALVLLNTNIERIQYSDYIIDSFRIAANNNEANHRIDYSINFANLNSPSFTVPGFNLYGYLDSGIVNGNIELLDEEKKLRYKVPFNLVTVTDIPELHIDESLIINNKTWTASALNVIYLDANHLKGSTLSINNSNQLLSIEADDNNNSGLPLVLRFNNFSIRNITDIAMPKDSTMFDGRLNGNVTLQSIDKLLFTSDLAVDSLKLSGVSAGNLTVKANQLTENIIDINAGLNGYGNDLSLSGTFNSSTSAPDLLLNVKQFNLANARIATSGMLDNLRGNMNGSLTIKGTTDAPDINGSLQFDSLKTIYRAYNTYINLPGGQIVFEQGNIRLNNINLLDSTGNKASITGNLFTKDFKSINMNLRVRSTNFMAIGPKIYPEQTIFGPARVNTNVTLTGDMETLYLKGNIRLADKSQFTYINIPQDNITKGEGLIEFFDPSNTDTTIIAKPVELPRETNIGMALNINVNETSTITIMMDQMSGDHLRIKGAADLNVTQEPGGEMYLSGKYVIDEGGYKLSLLGVSRKEFSIQKGSTITWAGDPMKGNMDITAMYQVTTSAGELVQDVDQSSGIGKQKMGFQVYLTLEGELLKPQINFRLDMAERDRQLFNGVVYSRIKQVNTIPAELNKQVIGLLALNRFIADNPFNSLTSSGGGNFETNLYNTAGQYLTRELSDLLSNAIKGFDIDLGLDMRENYINGTAQRNTNFNVGVTKKLANDRLSVYVGSSFALEGQNQDYSAASGLAGNIIIEYLLTKDGRYRIKGFRTTENETILQGNIIKTGISFVMVFEFNRFKQIFQPKGFYRRQQN